MSHTTALHIRASQVLDYLCDVSTALWLCVQLQSHANTRTTWEAITGSAPPQKSYWSPLYPIEREAQLGVEPEFSLVSHCYEEGITSIAT